MDLTAIILSCSALLAPEILATIIDAESGGDPYLIQVDGRRLESSSAAEAVGRARALLADGYTIRAGLMQISSDGWEQYGLTLETAFDPCRSVRGGEQAVMEGFLLSRGVRFQDEAQTSAPDVPRERAWAMPPALDGFSITFDQ